MKVFYICNGLRLGCERTSCSYLGRGECRRTMSELYALYGKADQITEERFVITDDMAIEIDREKEEVMKNDET